MIFALLSRYARTHLSLHGGKTRYFQSGEERLPDQSPLSRDVLFIPSFLTVLNIFRSLLSSKKLGEWGSRKHCWRLSQIWTEILNFNMVVYFSEDLQADLDGMECNDMCALFIR